MTPCNLDYDVYTKNGQLDFVAAGGIRVSQTHPFYSFFFLAKFFQGWMQGWQRQVMEGPSSDKLLQTRKLQP